MFTCLNFECFSPIFSKGYWGLDMCHRLIGGLRGCIVWINFFLERGHVSNTYNTALTAVAHPYQLLSVPTSCNRIRRGLPVIIVQRTCLACSFSTAGHWAIRTGSRLGRLSSGLVGGLVGEPEACQWWSSRDACFFARSV